MTEIGDPQLLPELLAAVTRDEARARLQAARSLRLLSERAPELIYPHFELFVKLRRDKNSIVRWNAMLVLGNLAVVDTERKLDRMIDNYLAPIDGPHLIDAANTIRGACAIAAAKPPLADTIARHIQKAERAVYATPECRNVALGHAITALDRLFPLLTHKHSIRPFVSRQLENARAATRGKAQRFLHHWPEASAAVPQSRVTKA